MSECKADVRDVRLANNRHCQYVDFDSVCISGLALLISFPAAPGKYQRWPNQWRFTSISNPLCITEFRASSASELCENL